MIEGGLVAGLIIIALVCVWMARIAGDTEGLMLEVFWWWSATMCGATAVASAWLFWGWK